MSKNTNTPLANQMANRTSESAGSSTESSAEQTKRSPAIERFLKKPSKALLIWTAVLLGGGAIAYFNFSQHAPRSLSPAGTQLVPQTALATVTLTTDELTWTKLRQFGTPESQEQLDGWLNQLQTQLLSASGYSFRRDIKPWIGDRVTLALLPADSDSDTTGPDSELASAAQNLVLVVPIADAAKAQALLDPAANPSTSDAGTSEADPPAVTTLERASRSYRGIAVQTLTSPDGQTLESAVIGSDWLLLSNTPEGIEQAIDTHKGQRSLLDNAGYRRAATRIESPQPRGKNFAQIYLNIPAATRALAASSGPTEGTPLQSQSSLIPLQGSDGIVATALIESEGIRFQGTSWLSPENDLAYGDLRNEAGEMPRRLPGNTLVAVSGSNLQQFWQGFSESNTAPPFFPTAQNLRALLLTQTGLDIEEDIMPWAAGEFALGVLPPNIAGGTAGGTAGNTLPGAAAPDLPASPNAARPEPPTDPSVIASAPLLMMVQTNDRQTADAVWSQIDDVMAARHRYQVETTEFEGGSITEWISPFQGVRFSHGWLPGNVAFFAVGDGAAEAIAPSPDQPLSGTRLFQSLTSQAPQPNNGHFYMNLEQINQLGRVFPLPPVPAEGPIADIRSIGLTTEVGDRTMGYDLYVKLIKSE